MKNIYRILHYIESQGLSITRLEKEAGFSNGYLLNTKKRGADITGKALIKLKNNLPNHYYKIFPEEKTEGVNDMPEGRLAEEFIEPCEKYITENNHLKEIVNKLESTINDKNIIIESKNEIIALQRQLLGGKSNQASV